MKRRIALIGLFMCATLLVGACGKTSDKKAEKHTYIQCDKVEATCDKEGNELYYTCSNCDKIFDAQKKEIAEIPVVSALGHTYILSMEEAATCKVKGEIAHYTCDVCDKIFNLMKEEIQSTEWGYDFSNHAGEGALLLQAQPKKSTYFIAESFDPTDMVILSKCGECEGEIIDNQFLTYVYQTENANAFSEGDTKITVAFREYSLDVQVKVEKAKTEISDVEGSYTTACGVEPAIAAKSSDPNDVIHIEYYDGDTQVQAADMLAGNTYTAKIYVEETVNKDGAEVYAQVVVEHGYTWQTAKEDADKLVLACQCGMKESYYVKNNQTVYVDDTDMSIDLSQFVCDTDAYSVKSVEQILLNNGQEKVAIDGEKKGNTYTFSVDKYERLNQDWTPYYLALSVTYEIGGKDCVATLTSKYVEKVIKTAEDLKAIAYTNAPTDGEASAKLGNYVLVNDIDASGVTLYGGNPCWVAAGGFRGIFEGNGYTIRNLSIPANNNGLFGAIGYGAQIQNVTFENVNVANGSYLLAFAIRNAYLTNVAIEFSVDSSYYKAAYTANDCEFSNVSVLTVKDDAPFLIGENAANAIPDTVTINNFMQYTVTFNTDGGNVIPAVEVTMGKTVTQPDTPVKTSEKYDYNFLGWYWNDTAWDFRTPVTQDMNLIAKWEEVEKGSGSETAANVLLNAKTQTLQKWDYGNAISVTSATDATYGAIWKVSIDNIAEQSIQHTAIDTADYERVYFYVYNPCAHEVRLVIHGGYGAWGEMTLILEANSWTKVEVNVSTFNKDQVGKIYLMLQDPDAVSIGGEWKITSFYGLKAGEEAPEI